MTPSLRAPDFGRRADSYDALRPGIPGLDRALVRAGDLAGRAVLDVGCGTGRLAETLVREFGARVVGLDAAQEMVAAARRRGVPGLTCTQGRAEQLPFEDERFERATMVLVCHLLERPAAFVELRRVLGKGGRLAIATFDPGYFSDHYLSEFFPSIQEIDLARFPDLETLESELRAAGFAEVEAEPFAADTAIGRPDALRRIRNRHISTFDLIGEEEYRQGLERAERELPAELPIHFELLIVTAS